MSNQMLELLAQYAALRLGCERALELLEDPDASEFDADKVIALLQTILEVKKMEKFYMNSFTGSVDTEDGWYPEDITTLIEVVKDKEGFWVEVK
jgi:hypothetical protein